VAPLCLGRRGSRLVLLDIESESCYNYKEKAPKSDALCIERHAERFYTGHRNGWLSIVDLRTEYTDSFAPEDASAGSLTKIMVMGDGNQILTKHSFGSCFLWDVRMMGHESDGKVSPLLQLRVPKSMIHRTKSSCCNGVALDPTESIFISPFANFNERACLAFWSLASGAFIGSRELCAAESMPDAETANNVVGMPHCELSSTITPGWKPITSFNGGDTVEPDNDAWGLWFKIGLSFTRQPTPSFVCSIHHVTFPGRMMDIETTGQAIQD